MNKARHSNHEVSQRTSFKTREKTYLKRLMDELMKENTPRSVIDKNRETMNFHSLT